MNIVFFGSSEFAVESLKALLKEHNILAVFTQPDRKKGRHLHLGKTPVKVFAEENSITVFAPQDLLEPQVIAQLESFNADLFVVVSFGRKLSKTILEMPKYFCVNVHASLLPKYRGAAPINMAIVNGDKVTGVSIIKMNERMDCGDLILSKSVDINADDDALTLTEKLAGLGAQALVEVVGAIEKDKVSFKKQDELKAIVTKKLRKEDGLIKWEDKALNIHNKVRGLLPWPCAYTYYKGKFLKILKTTVLTDQVYKEQEVCPGEIVAIEKNRGVVVSTTKDLLLIKRLQIEGKCAMSAYDFVLGHHLKKGEKFG